MAADTIDAVRPRLWLKAEFATLYFGAPLVIALFMPPRMIFQALFVLLLAGLFLLWRTGGFQWRSLFREWRRVQWGYVLLFGLTTGALGYSIMSLTVEGYSPDFTPERLRFMVVIWFFYPFFSALPQELIFRPLFFFRYRAILPERRSAIILNAAIFSLAHLMYWSWVVALLTFLGGLAFARGYLRLGFPYAWMLHAIAGNMLFLVGMGYYFWSGNVVRPF